MTAAGQHARAGAVDPGKWSRSVMTTDSHGQMVAAQEYTGTTFSGMLPKSDPVRDNDVMETPINRAELDAKLETIEARMDGRLARIEDRFTSIDRQFAELRTTLAEQRSVAWKAAGTTIAIIVGAIIAAFILSFNAFNSGRETSKMALQAQATATQARQETAAALTQIRQIVSDLKAAQPQQK